MLTASTPLSSPRCVRSYGEDTFLISAFARHFVWGLQGRTLSNATVISEPKHYAAHSIPEGGRNTAVSHVGPREMLDTFLPQFEAAVHAGALSIMSAYSEYDGMPCSGSHYLLTEVLREQFGFKGFVLSDLGAVALLANGHRVAATPEDAIKRFLIAGGNSQFYDYSHEQYQNAIINGVADGSLPLTVLNERVADLLRVRELLRLNEQPLTDPELAARDVNTPQAKALALQLAQESLVLLKNSHVGSTPFLPLAPRVRSGAVKRLAVVGPLADQLEVADYAGPFNSINNAQSTVLLAALARRAAADKTILAYAAGVWPTTGTDSAVTDRGHYPSGLSVSYYSTHNLTGPVVLNRTEVMLGSTFYLYGFAPEFPSNTFSARWTGSVVWPATVLNGRLLVNTADQGRVRLLLDGRVLVEQWNSTGKCQPCAAPYAFVQGEAHEVVVEYGQTGTGQLLSLAWDLVGDDAELSIQRAVAAAMQADAVVVAVGDNGRTSGEGIDRVSLDLSGLQEPLIHALAAVGKPLVVVMYSGRAPAIPAVAANPNVTAILEAYEPGQSQGDALASVLYGDFNPGGRLPLTYPINTGQVPLFYKSQPHSNSSRQPPSPLLAHADLLPAAAVRVLCCAQSQGRGLVEQLRRPVAFRARVSLRLWPLVLFLQLLRPQHQPRQRHRLVARHCAFHAAQHVAHAGHGDASAVPDRPRVVHHHAREGAARLRPSAPGRRRARAGGDDAQRVAALPPAGRGAAVDGGARRVRRGHQQRQLGPGRAAQGSIQSHRRGAAGKTALAGLEWGAQAASGQGAERADGAGETGEGEDSGLARPRTRSCCHSVGSGFA